ncbi:MAG: purine-nucleoside phosphorylase [Planctomycetes bacterium]|nr:purine-nucleoside phosphorylase [Planctomycetota bacterium]
MSDPYARVEAAAAAIRRHWPGRPDFGVILGTGLEGLAHAVQDPVVLSYREVEGFRQPSVVSHGGTLHLGTIGGKPVMVMAGRYHLYEGYSGEDVVLPVRVMKALGAHTLLVSCACGSMNPHLRTGDLALIEDHLNLMGHNPLVGINDDRLGPRFPDMCAPYDRALLARAEAICLEEGFRARPVVHAAVLGPNLETRAEYRALQILGADTVGMSTIPEVLAAVHAGLKVFGAGCVTDLCLPEALCPVNIQEILRIAAGTDPKLTRLFERMIGES